MATQDLTLPAISSPGSENGEPGADLTLEQKLANLEEKYTALERKFTHLYEKNITITENGSGEVTNVSVKLPTTNGASDGSTVSSLLPLHYYRQYLIESKTGEKETGPTSRAKIVINRVDTTTGERKDQLPSDTSLEVSKKQDTSHAFLLRKNIDMHNEKENDGELEIIDPDLWNLLKKLLSHYPYHIFKGEPKPIESPYEPLILNWDGLEAATRDSATDEKDSQARSDLKLVLETISSGSSGDLKLDKYFKIRLPNVEQNMVTFESLWTIFSPGALVYGKPFLGQDQIFIVQDYLATWPQTRRKPKWSLQCLTYDWDGRSFKRVALQLDIDNFEGSKPITSLPFYPLHYHQQPEILKQRLVERGAKFKRFCTAEKGSQMFDYRGDVVWGQKGFSGIRGDDEDDDDRTTSSYDQDLEYSGRGSRNSNSDPAEATSKPSSVNSRVMVDFQSYVHYGPAVAKIGSLEPIVDSFECACHECQKDTALRTIYKVRFDEADHQEKWEDEQYMLCPPRILGYILIDKQWAQLRVTGLRDIPKTDLDHSWNRVKLADGEETKKMILNLVNGHGTADSKDDDSGLAVDDIVAKKGKGLVILLYGPPGVGKTSTAETVAIAARKPLFSISVADVGTKAKKVEANLAKLFALATSWQAILLIDEADVFLESRGKGASSSTERNALVSVFLRVLEYYQGILMLTTNQIAHFDVAVQSRIHVAIKYGKLSETQTLAIFEGFLKPLDEKDLVKDMDDIREWIKEDVCKIGLDGRQIRNIVTSALGLARAERKRRLDKKDLKKILNNVRDYKDDFVRQFEKYKNSQDGMIG